MRRNAVPFAGPAAGMMLMAALAAATLGVVVGMRVAERDFVRQHWWLVALLVVGIVDAAVGSALLSRLPRRRVGWCLLLGGAAAVVAVVLATAPGYPIAPSPAWDEIGATESWARPLAAGVLVALVPWELAVGQRSRRWESAWWITAALVAASVVGEAAGARAPGLDVVDLATWLVAGSATAATALLVADWWRSRGGDDALRGWIAAGAVVAWLAVVPERVGIDAWGLPGSHVVGALMLLATIPLLLVGVVVRALRDRPGRFHGLAHDVISWLVLSAAIVAVYTVAVAGVGRALGGADSTWLLVVATGVIAVAAEPARHRVRAAVDRLVWGDRDDPLTVVRGVVDRVGADTDGELLPTLAGSLQRELRLDAVAIDVRTSTGWQRAASVGPPTARRRTVLLGQHGETIGRLVVGWEHGPHLRVKDERVLGALAGPLALAVGWVRLADELRRSTDAVASTREAERRRLRRDLHDGLGPSLTGVSLGVRAAARQLERSPQADTVASSRLLLERTADEVDLLVGEVRRIVRDLRPTALDRAGLDDALRAFLRTVDDRVDVSTELPASVPGLSAAAEVAVYRTVSEAVTNVVRHARASRCRVTVEITDGGRWLEAVVADDGIGAGRDPTPGVGLTAMRERAAELGGRVDVVPRVPNGTTVRLRVPLDAT